MSRLSCCRRANRSLIMAIAFLLSLACQASGYNPPVDTAGPLTVRILGPETIETTESPLAIQVRLDNRADHAIEGRLSLGVIDGWRCDPADAVPFRVAGNTSTTMDFQVQVDAQTYAAHYPIHARAQFDWAEESLTAHPILIVDCHVVPPRPVLEPLPWQSIPLEANSQLALLQIPVFRSVAAVFEKDAEVMPVGWMGSAESHRASVGVQRGVELDGSRRDVIAIHPPWAQGQVGTAWIEYPVRLPSQTPVRVRFATAVTPTGEGDGVTSRVRVARANDPADALGTVVFERHSAAKSWEQGEVNLDRYAGQEIRLQLESHPGPKNNTAFDQSYWAEPTIVCGNPPPPAEFPPAAWDTGRSLGSSNGPNNGWETRVWPGHRGLLDGVIGIRAGERQLYLGGLQVRVLGMQLEDPASPAILKAAEWKAVDDGFLVSHRFETPYGPLTLLGRITVSHGAIRCGLRLEEAPRRRPWFAPHIEAMALGRCSEPVQRVYAGVGNVIEQPGAFELSFDGHRLATSHVGFDFADGLSLVQAVDLPPLSLVVDPGRQHASLHAAHNAEFLLIPGQDVWEAAGVYRDLYDRPAAAGVADLAGRFVFDLWGGKYGDSGQQLQLAFRYGLTDAAVVWHNWQRWGYDYRLPEIYPPNLRWGDEAELAEMIDACDAAGVLFALHDNYIDMYPDAEGFSYEDEIAFHGDGRPVLAWLNRGRDARSYRFRADRVDPYLRANLEKIQQRLHPTAYFIDVWSSARPYDYWTADGRFFDAVSTRNTWGEHFAWIRRLQGNDAPQISESGHDQLIGWLDGAQTNHLRVGKPLAGEYSWSVWNIDCEDAERIPWMDFAHHDRFVLHGAGYSSRYQAGLDGRLHGMYSDDYMTTEMLTGHPAMVSRPFSRDVVRKYWLTQNVMRALALQTIESVEFDDGDLHRQSVHWSGGAWVLVNRGQKDWQCNAAMLPEYGFHASIPTPDGIVVASIQRRDGQIVELASSPEQVYVNGRQVVGGPVQIRPSAESIRWSGPSRLAMQLLWQADEPIPDGYRPFVHFVDAAGEIAFQGAYDAQVLTAHRQGQIELPTAAFLPVERKPGDEFELRVGLYNPTGGPRLPLLGRDDGERRFRLGTVTLTGDGEQVTGIRWTPFQPGTDPYLARRNPQKKPIDFGAIVTAGGCRVVRHGESVVLTPLPGSDRAGSEFLVRWDRLPWRLAEPTVIEVLDVAGEVVRTLPVGEPLLLRCSPGDFAFRFR